jgi:hypothetical protein
VALRDDLEAALAERWDDDNLAVYGDHLESHSDPRGALIAIDRGIDRALGGRDQISTDQLLGDQAAATYTIDQRREYLVAWLGERLVSQLPRHGSARFGFIDDLRVHDDLESLDFFRELLASPARAYLRRLRLSGMYLKPMFEVLAAAPNPWLQELAIIEDPPEGGHLWDVPPALGERLVAVTPRLRAMRLHGHNLLEEFPHPHLRSLIVRGFTALGTLAGDGPPLSALHHLDLGFSGDSGAPYEAPAPARVVAALLPAARLPALRELDLSRNEPGPRTATALGVHSHGGKIDPFRFVQGLALAPQLTRLAMPTVRTPEQAQRLSAALARMPALTRLELPHGYRGLPPPPAIDHPTAELHVAPPWPWRPMDQLWAFGRLAIAGGPPIAVHPSLVTLAIRLEVAWEALGAEARARWDALFRALEPLFQHAATVMMDSRVFIAAFATLPPRSYLHGWTAVYDALRAAQPRAFQLAVRLAPAGRPAWDE